MGKKKLNLCAVMVLHALASGRSYGFDIMVETGLSGGTIYPALDRLDALGFVVSDWEDVRAAREEKRPPRRNCRITAEGARELQAALGALAPGGFGCGSKVKLYSLPTSTVSAELVDFGARFWCAVGARGRGQSSSAR